MMMGLRKDEAEPFCRKTSDEQLAGPLGPIRGPERQGKSWIQQRKRSMQKRSVEDNFNSKMMCSRCKYSFEHGNRGTT